MDRATKIKFKPTQIAAANDIIGLGHNPGDLIDQMTKQFLDQKEDAILERLAKRGFTFKHHLEYVNFVRTRCEVRKWKLSNVDMLYVDGMPLFGWREEWITETDGFKYNLYFTE